MAVLGSGFHLVSRPGRHAQFDRETALVMNECEGRISQDKTEYSRVKATNEWL